MNGEAAKSLTGMSSPVDEVLSRYARKRQEPEQIIERSMREQSEFQAQEAADKAQREATRARSKAAGFRQESASVRDSAEQKSLQSIEQRMMDEATFVPTKETAGDMAQLFALINIAGFAMGAGGKRNAQAAMSGMNGMMEGYQQGRADLYKKEKDVFESNLKALKTKSDILTRRLQEVAKLAQTDRLAADAEADALFAEQGASFMKQFKDKYGLAGVIEYNKQRLQSIDKAMEIETRLREKESQARRQAEADARAQRREERAEFRFERAIQKATAASSQKKEGKPLPDKQLRDIEGLSSLEEGLLKLRQDWKPEYAQFGLPSGFLGFGAGIKEDLERRLGRKAAQEMISWWSSYSRYQAPGRHALFGATLTGPELQNFRTFTATTKDGSETVETMLEDQINYVRSTAANKIFAAESAGYRVPEIRARNFEETLGGGQGAATPSPSATAPGAARQGQAAPANTEAQARAAFGSYEPDKYEYGVNPATGKFARRRKQ